MTTNATERAAWHESGHAIVAFNLAGLTVASVSLLDQGTIRGRVLVSFSHQTDRGFWREQEENICCATLAGPAAEEMQFGSGTGHVQDMKDAEAIAARLRPDYPPGAAALLAWQAERAKQILRWHWHKVERLAAELLRCRTLTGDEARKAAGML